MHSNSFVLVDDKARVRGYYRANNDGIADLERDLRALAAPTTSER
jgi:cytochrome oxidase Cu insertion factor (SCO1/SenC/PrrC family)